MAVDRSGDCAQAPSTIRVRAIRHAGSDAATSPTASAAANCSATVSAPTATAGKNDPTVAAKASVSGNVSAMPSRPPTSAMAIDSAKIRAATNPPPKPSVFSVAYSALRSRAVIAMVFAITAMMMTMTTKLTAWIATRMVSAIATKPSWNAFSVSVRVSASEFRNVASIACETSAACWGSASSSMNTPVWSPRRG